MQFKTLGQNMLDMLVDNVLNKQSYHKILEELDSIIPEIAGESPESPEYSEMFAHFAAYESQQAKAAHAILDVIKEQPAAGVCQLVTLCQEHLRKILTYQNIGHISDAYLTAPSALEVDIFTSPGSNSIFHDKDATKAIIKEFQQSILEQNYDMSESELGDVILNTEKSNRSLCALLEKINASYIRTDTVQVRLKDKSNAQEIRRTKFRVDPGDLLSYEPPALPEIILPAEEGELNEDERLFLICEIKDMYSAYMYTQEDPRLNTQSAKNIIWHAFSNICEKLDYHGSVYKTVKQQYEQSRKQAYETKEMEQEIKRQMQPNAVSEHFQSVLNQVEEITAAHMRFDIAEIRVYEHMVRMRLRLVQDHYFCSASVMPSDDFYEIFKDQTIGMFRQDDVMIKVTDSSLAILNELLKKNLPGAVIQNMDVQACNAYHDPTLVFCSFTIQVNNIAEFIQQFGSSVDNLTEKTTF